VGATGARLSLCAYNRDQALGCFEEDARIINRPVTTELPAPPQLESGTVWSNGLTLVGYDLEREGQQETLTLYWRVDAAQPLALKRFVHAVDANGTMVAQADATPENGGAPMATWQPGEYVIDEVRLALPSGAQLDQLRVGWYDPATGSRIPATGPDGMPLPDGFLPVAPD
jgi:hypothetical protein